MRAATSPGMVLAGFWRRVLAQFIDVLWTLPLSLAMGLAGSLLRGGEEAPVLSELLQNLILALVVLIFWAGRQATPGKWVLGLRIVAAEDGGQVPIGRLVARYLGYIVSGLPFGLGFFWMLWDPRRQCWHDKLARTLVVRDLAPGEVPPGPSTVRFG
ncbi:RDD family protein [Siccirubricoccus sp. KC 17139]|uniref:RDD family protein n=1 Tax=Siccirubricoccus soli TaxID=2899147 RepID=A0ABT1DFF6_9PROT|nr:RDD family protein [Siccirubricoccus soli]MCO6419685.1 RDD family protein [Siccirubricoccus soli]MCP2685820.1 RDD family protein [Siccirubricoccus soli]